VCCVQEEVEAQELGTQLPEESVHLPQSMGLSWHIYSGEGASLSVFIEFGFNKESV